MSFVDDVRQRLDIVAVISDYVPLQKAGRYFKAQCPFHNERTPSFFVYPDRQTWHCFGACGTGGDVFSFVMKRENLPFGEALRLLAERAAVPIPSRQREQAAPHERLFQANQLAAQHYHSLLTTSAEAGRARDYLARRGLSEEAVVAFQLGYSPDAWDSLRQ